MTKLPEIKRIAALPHYEPTYEQRFALMGEELIFQTNHQSLLDAAEEAFGRFPLSKTSPGKPLVVRLFIQEPTSEQLGSEGASLPQPVFSTQRHIFTIIFHVKKSYRLL